MFKRTTVIMNSIIRKTFRLTSPRSKEPATRSLRWKAGWTWSRACWNGSPTYASTPAKVTGATSESQVPAILEWLGIPYSAAAALGNAVTLYKPMTKRVLHGCSLPTPDWQTFNRPDEPLRPWLRFPCLPSLHAKAAAWASATSPSCTMKPTCVSRWPT